MIDRESNPRTIPKGCGVSETIPAKNEKTGFSASEICNPKPHMKLHFFKANRKISNIE